MIYEIITNEDESQIIKWNDNGVIRFIPCDELNSDYQTYLASLDETAPEQSS